MTEEAQQKDKIEKFFSDAFCAKSANIIYGAYPNDFKIIGVVEINCDDVRGTMYLGLLDVIKKSNPDHDGHAS